MKVAVELLMLKEDMFILIGKEGRAPPVDPVKLKVPEPAVVHAVLRVMPWDEVAVLLFVPVREIEPEVVVIPVALLK